MQKYKRTYLIGVFAAVMLSVVSPFNNCSNVDFAAGQDKSSSLGDPSGDPVPDPEVEEAIRNCENLKAKNQLTKTTQSIVFEDSKVDTGRSQVCLFNQDGNLGMFNEEMRARHEQYQDLNLPANAVICDVKMQTQLQKFKYDDAFFLTLNGHILASNNKAAVMSRLDAETVNIMQATPLSLYKYDWSRLVTHTFSQKADDFCLGSDQGLSECSWPLTEKTGNIDFEFHPEILVRLGLKSANPRFGFVVSGDDNPDSDCYHEKLQFSLDVEYYIK